MEYVEEIVSLKDQLSYDGEIDTKTDFSNVVIAGMGGSGIAGKIFSLMYREKPVFIISSYDIPEFVDHSTLFIAISYSGNTEETIYAVREAMRRRAQIAAITTGGKLSEIIKNAILIPSGLQPRSAVGFLTIPLLRGFKLIGEGDIEETKDALAKIDGNTVELES
ncbi:MAG: SIS domain-containing protein, partial [Thermoplasmatales archaeon]